MKTLVKIDKNGSKHYIEDECPRCHGTGRYGTYGVCFKCNGSGKYEHTIIERTPEYEKKLAEKRAERAFERAKANASKWNERLFKWNNLGENGDVYIVLGNTFSIKDELKADGARFNSIFGWYFNKPYNKYPTERIEGKVFLNEYETGELEIDWEKAEKAVDEIKSAYDKANNTSSSEWVGEVGRKIKLPLTLIKEFQYHTNYSYYGESNSIYKFEDEDGNIFVWKTSSKGDIEEGKTYDILGTIKSHDEYKGEKQTNLTRCRYHEI